MSKYVPKKDRAARSAEQRALAVLETVCDSDAPAEQKQAAAAATLDFLAARERNTNRVEPLRKAVAERIKEVRTLRQHVERLTGELEATKARIAELETVASDTANERDALRSDVSRLGADLSAARSGRASAESEVRNSQRKAATAEGDAAKLRTSLTVLGSRLHGDEDFSNRLLVEHGDELSPELFLNVFGWTKEQYDAWLSQWKRDRNASSDDLVELLHRESCVCSQEHTNLKRPSGELAVFLRSMLTHRGVKVEAEVAALVQRHREDWFKRNRAPIGDVPLAARRIEEIPRPVAWNRD